MAALETHSLLLALPEACLVAVLECCAADNLRSLFSAARSHSRLHQAAIAALHTISAVVRQQQQADNLLLFLSKHGYDVDNLFLEGPADHTVTIRQLPSSMQLDSLSLDSLQLQLQQGGGFRGVLGAAADIAGLQRLQLSYCKLLDGNEAYPTSPRWEAALAQLPAGLKALCVAAVEINGFWAPFPIAVCQQLQQLTYLELHGVLVQPAEQGSPVLQGLQALTGLVELKLDMLNADDTPIPFTASLLSSTCRLTRLELVEPEDDEVSNWVHLHSSFQLISILFTH